jgi:hypothetical protein
VLTTRKRCTTVLCIEGRRYAGAKLRRNWVGEARTSPQRSGVAAGGFEGEVSVVKGWGVHLADAHFWTGRRSRGDDPDDERRWDPSAAAEEARQAESESGLPMFWRHGVHRAPRVAWDFRKKLVQMAAPMCRVVALPISSNGRPIEMASIRPRSLDPVSGLRLLADVPGSTFPKPPTLRAQRPETHCAHAGQPSPAARQSITRAARHRDHGRARAGDRLFRLLGLSLPTRGALLARRCSPMLRA